MEALIGICAHCNTIIDKPPYVREWTGSLDRPGRYWHEECSEEAPE